MFGRFLMHLDLDLTEVVLKPNVPTWPISCWDVAKYQIFWWAKLRSTTLCVWMITRKDVVVFLLYQKSLKALNVQFWKLSRWDTTLGFSSTGRLHLNLFKEFFVLNIVSPLDIHVLEQIAMKEKGFQWLLSRIIKNFDIIMLWHQAWPNQKGAVC